MVAKLAAPTTRNGFHRTPAAWGWSGAHHRSGQRAFAPGDARRYSRCQSGRAARALWRERQPHVHCAGAAALEDHEKKKSLVCSEQQDPKVQKQRKAWQRKIKDIEPGRFKFLDQTNAKTTLTRVFGRARRGQRVREYVPDGRWESLTLMGTLGYWGDTTALTYEGGTDVPVMVTFLEQVLVPVLDRDHIVVLDRLSSHMDPQVAKAVRKTGAKLWHLPPYSHDFNPIEKMWSKIKAYLRKVKARDVDALIGAIGKALKTITAEDAQGWFSHCGYK